MFVKKDLRLGILKDTPKNKKFHRYYLLIILRYRPESPEDGFGGY